MHRDRNSTENRSKVSRGRVLKSKASNLEERFSSKNLRHQAVQELFRIFFFIAQSLHRAELVQKVSKLHDTVGSDEQVLSQWIHDLFAENSLNFFVLFTVFGVTRSEQQGVEDAGECEHGEESRVEVARIVMSLDALELAAVGLEIFKIDEF